MNREPSPLSNSLLGLALEGSFGLLVRWVLVPVVAFGLGVAGLALHEARQRARHWSLSQKWRREREEQERKAGK